MGSDRHELKKLQYFLISKLQATVLEILQNISEITTPIPFSFAYWLTNFAENGETQPRALAIYLRNILLQ